MRHRVDIVPRGPQTSGAGRWPSDWLHHSLQPQLFTAEHRPTAGIAALLRGICSLFDSGNSIKTHVCRVPSAGPHQPSFVVRHTSHVTRHRLSASSRV